MKRALVLLSFDSLAALVAGSVTLFSAPLLTVWFSWPEGFARFLALVNISYGCYSGILALRLRWKNQLSRWTVIILVAANSLWALNCFIQAWRLHGTASFLGLGHLVFEGFFVGGLAYLEARMVLPSAE